MTGFAPASQSQLDEALPQKSNAVVWSIIAILLVAVAVAFGFVANAMYVSDSVCLSGCVPPQTPPLHAPHVYHSSKYGFSLEYFDSRDTSLDKTIEDSSSIGWQVRGNPFYQWEIGGGNAGGQDAQQIVEGMKSSDFPNANLVYTIPQAEIGYTPGYGNVYDDYVAPASGDAAHVRLFIMAAVKNRIAVAMEGLGLYKKINYGHPNPSLSPAPLLFDAILNTVTWKGEPPL